jgi:hypothetical protein
LSKIRIGDVMKKKLSIFILMTFLIVMFGINYKPLTVEDKPDTYQVIEYMDNEDEKDPNEFKDYYLLFDSFKLDSNNFVDVMSFFDKYEYKIVAVYPYVNLMYHSILGNTSKINYNASSLGEGIGLVYNTYLKKLEDNRLTSEVDKLLVNGMRIRMLKINTSYNILKIFLDHYPLVKYNLLPYGLFRDNNV